jgi:hypothetical protein
MRYELRVANRIGPFVKSTLGDAKLVPRPPGTRLTITCREPISVAHLLSRLDLLGLEIEVIHTRRIGHKA